MWNSRGKQYILQLTSVQLNRWGGNEWLLQIWSLILFVRFFSIAAHHHHRFNQFNKLCVKCYKTINNQTKPNQTETWNGNPSSKHLPEISTDVSLYDLFGDFFILHETRFYIVFVSLSFHLFSIPFFFHVENVILHQNVAMLNENNDS